MIAAAASLFWTAGSLAAAAGQDRLPDLAMARPVDLQVDRISTGSRYLRFTAMIVNIGVGPFETRASRTSLRATTMAVKQRVHDATGGYRVVRTGALASYSRVNNCNWTTIRLRSSAVVSVIDWGAGCSLPGAPMPTPTPSVEPSPTPSPEPIRSASPMASPATFRGSIAVAAIPPAPPGGQP